jgi:hypothetical protein
VGEFFQRFLISFPNDESFDFSLGIEFGRVVTTFLWRLAAYSAESSAVIFVTPTSSRKCYPGYECSRNFDRYSGSCTELIGLTQMNFGVILIG